MTVAFRPVRRPALGHRQVLCDAVRQVFRDGSKGTLLSEIRRRSSAVRFSKVLVTLGMPEAAAW